jgi:hypothetical protein
MLCYYTNGGINHSQAYSLPIYLRIFYLRTLAKFKEKENPKQSSKNDKWGKEDMMDSTLQGMQNKKMLHNINQMPRQK